MRPGSRQRTGAGVVEIVSVEEVDPASLTEDDARAAAAGVAGLAPVEGADPAPLTEDDARAAGVASLARLHRLLDRRPGPGLYRMQVRWAGPDPRVALRAEATLSDDDRLALDQRLHRLGTPPGTPWARGGARAIGGRAGLAGPGPAA